MDTARAVEDSLRAHDPDLYASTLYAPAASRRALNALRAFDAELVTIRDRVREPMAGEIRLKWWQEVLRAGAPTGNPVADELIDAIRAHDLPVNAFDAYLDARIFDLYDDAFPTRGDLEAYAGETAGAVFQLAVMVLNRANAPAAADACGYGGCLAVLGRFLGALPRMVARGQCPVPRDILDATGTTREHLATSPDAQVRVVAAMASLAGEHAASFLSAVAGLPAPARTAFLPLAGLPGRMSALAADPPDFAGLPSPPSRLVRQWQMLRVATFGWPARD